MKLIPLTQGLFSQVDDEDFDLLNKHKWQAVNYHGYYYAVCKIKNKQVKMHRFILNINDNSITDHIDHNGLNNQKVNIRVCNHRQNAMNNKKHTDGKSQFKGVWLCKGRNKTRIRGGIRVNGDLINLGSFDSEIKAALTYDQAAKFYFGEYAKLNFK